MYSRVYTVVDACERAQLCAKASPTRSLLSGPFGDALTLTGRTFALSARCGYRQRKLSLGKDASQWMKLVNLLCRLCALCSFA